MAPTSQNILSREISNGGYVSPSGSDIVIADNAIHHLRYNGMSLSQLDYQILAENVIIHGNYVHNIVQHIFCDKAAIYTVGIQSGTVITGNVVKKCLHLCRINVGYLS